MFSDFIVTSITRVVLVGPNEYANDRLDFSGPISNNELIFNFSGEATVCFDGVTADTSPDTIRLLPRRERPVTYTVDRHTRGECIDVCFRTDRPVSDRMEIMDVKNNVRLQTLFQRTFAVWVARNEGYEYECMALLYQILAELKKEHYASPAVSARLLPVTDYIAGHFMTEPLTCESLAAMAEVTPSYLNRLFRAKYNVSTMQYVIRLRLNYAGDLLLSGRYSVSETAELAGFSDVCFFSRQFKKFMGATPTEYVRKYRSSK